MRACNHPGEVIRRIPSGFYTFLAVLLFASAASIRLTSQGLQYDELHQAPGAFAYIGKTPNPLVSLAIGGIPVMNMNYSAAIKTGLYGLYISHFAQISLSQ